MHGLGAYGVSPRCFTYNPGSVKDPNSAKGNGFLSHEALVVGGTLLGVPVGWILAEILSDILFARMGRLEILFRLPLLLASPLLHGVVCDGIAKAGSRWTPTLMVFGCDVGLAAGYFTHSWLLAQIDARLLPYVCLGSLLLHGFAGASIGARLGRRRDSFDE